MKNICIYCSSSNALESHFYDLAKELAHSMAQNNYNLIYGGSNVGLMHEIATTMLDEGANITGVIPQAIYDKGLGFDGEHDLIVTRDMSERKKKMIELADAFITLPGGFGTLEEFFETLTLKQLQYHNKAIVLLNHNNFFHNLIHVFQDLFDNKFAKPDYAEYFYIANNVTDAINYLKSYTPPDFKDKWYWVGSDQYK